LFVVVTLCAQGLEIADLVCSAPTLGDLVIDLESNLIVGWRLAALGAPLAV
jgi:hypothetical protein